MNDQQQDDSLVDESHLPLRSPLGKPMDYQEVLDADLLELLGAEGATDEQKKDIYEKAQATIENRVIARLMDEFTDEEMEQWEKLPEGDQDAMRTFLSNKNIDLPQLYAKEALVYKTEIASLAHQLKIKE
jgi:hypothetical protein